MYRDFKRFGKDPETVTRAKPDTFNAPMRKQMGPLIFVCSWSDFFIPEADEWRADAWNIIRRTPRLVYQILTKRPERIEQCLPDDWGGKGYPNVFLGVSAEDQRQADFRIPILLKIPARIRFLSCEPLLGRIDLMGSEYLRRHFVSYDDPRVLREQIDWVIVGGESGPDARPMLPGWVHTILGQCRYAKVPFFFKQWGEWMPVKDDMVMVGRTRAGRKLFGRTWDEMPEIERSCRQYVGKKTVFNGAECEEAH